MKILNLLTSGGLGGIEILNYDLAKYSTEDNGFAFLFGTGLTYDRMQKAGFKVYNLSGYKSKISIGRYKELIKIANNYDIVTVHHGDPYLKLYYCAILNKCKKKGVTFIHSCWDDSLFFPKNKIKYFIGKRLFQKALNLANVIVFVSEAGRKSYEKNFKINSNVSIVYNGIGLDKIQDGYSNVLVNGKPIQIIYIGRIEKIKGIDLLIDSLYEMKNDYYFHLKIIGNGSEKKCLNEKIQSLNMENMIELIDGTTDVKPYLRQGDIFVYPSICQEVFGIAIVEAMAYGLVCIANNVGGIPEVLIDGYNGFLNKTNNIDGLKIALTQAFDLLETSKYKEMGNRAKETAKKFSIISTCRNLDSIYEELK